MPTPREAFVNSVDPRGYSDARVRTPDFGAGAELLGQAVQGFGQQVGAVAKDVEAIQTRKAETLAKEVDSRYALRKQQSAYEGPDALFNLSGRRAVDAAPQFGETLSSLDREALEELKGNPLATRLYQETATARNRDLLLSASRHAGKELEVWTRQTAASGIETAVEAAAMAARDPEQIQVHLNTARSIARGEASRQGMDKDSIAAAERTAATKVIVAAANQIELESPGEAQAFLKLHAGDIDQTELFSALKVIAGPAAQERAGEIINNYLVTKDVETFDQGTVVPGSEGAATSTPTPPPSVMHTLIGAQESGNQERDGRGRLITSSAGAQGKMQVMPGTNTDPGFGVRPAANGSDAERSRVGRDYYDAMLKRYGGNVVLALTAYNWGPKSVDDHIKTAGDPRTGAISDGAWLNTIPVKEAREYAPSVLSRAGVAIGKSGASPANVPARAVSFEQEIDVEATVARIRADKELSHVEREALIAEARQVSTQHEQGRARQEERVTDAAWQTVNGMAPGSFTDYNQLPLAIRQQLDRNPRVAASFRNQAESNRAAAEAAKKAEVAEKSHEAELNFTELQYSNPDAFLRQDFRTAPNLTHEDRLKFIAAQEQLRKTRGTADDRSLEWSRVRSAVDRYLPKKKPGDNSHAGAYSAATRMAEALMKSNGNKPLNDAQLDAIARQTMLPVTVTQRGMLGDTKVVVPQYRLNEVKRRMGANFGGGKVDLREQVSAALQQELGRIPSTAEVDREIQELGL